MVKHYRDADSINLASGNPMLYAKSYQHPQTFSLYKVYWDRECTKLVSEDDAYKMFMNGNMFCILVDETHGDVIIELDCTHNSRGGFVSGKDNHSLFTFES